MTTIRRFPPGLTWLPRSHNLRWLCLLAALCLAAITLAYQRSEPHAVSLATHADDALLEGFHEPEGRGAGAFRWTEGRADARVPNLYPAQAVSLTLRLAAPRPEPGGRVPVELRVNNVPLDRLELGAAFVERSYRLEAATTGWDGNVYLTILAPPYAAPSDGRALGVMVSRLELTPLASPPFAPPVPIAVALVCGSLLVAVWERRLGVAERTARTLDVALIGVIALVLLWVRIPLLQLNARILFTLVVAFAATEAAARLGRFGADRRAYRAASALFLGAFALRMWLAQAPGDEANFIAFKAMLAQATTQGIAQVYGLDPVYGAYPPFHHYHLWLVGLIYQTFMAPDLFLGTLRLHYLMKMVTITYDVLITVLIAAYVARQRGTKTALAAGAAFALNPGIVYVSAYNGQFGDPIYSFYSALAVVGLLTRQPEMLGMGAVLALLTKPQAWAFAPFLALGALWQMGSARAIARTAGAGALAAALVLAPFALAGTLPEMARTVGTTIGHGPRISANAFNLWWLAGWGNAWNINDTLPLWGPISYRAFGLVLFFGVATGWIARHTWRAHTPGALAALAGFAGLAFFVLPTEIHENYLFPAFPLLALWAAHDRRAWGLLGVLGVTWFLNVVMIDQTLMVPLAAAVPLTNALWFPLSIVLAVVHVGVLALWAWRLREA